MLNSEIRQDIANIGYAKLMGSRSMAVRPSTDQFDPPSKIGNYINDATDWDFSQQYDEDHHNYLIAAGYDYWGPERLAGYADDLTVGVYVKHLHDGTSVNIVLHNNEELFRRVWDRITPEFYFKHIWKRSPYFSVARNTDRETKAYITSMMNQLYKIGVE
jgi:hypothetical protein